MPRIPPAKTTLRRMGMCPRRRWPISWATIAAEWRAESLLSSASLIRTNEKPGTHPRTAALQTRSPVSQTRSCSARRSSTQGSARWSLRFCTLESRVRGNIDWMSNGYATTAATGIRSENHRRAPHSHGASAIRSRVERSGNSSILQIGSSDLQRLKVIRFADDTIPVRAKKNRPANTLYRFFRLFRRKRF